MKIYFSCSITGGRNDQHIYQRIVEHLTLRGHEVLTAHLADAGVMDQEIVASAKDVFHRDVAWVEDCDALIAEVSTPSHGVGYEIALALCLGKPVLCCYQDGRTVSKMILGNDHPQMRLARYTGDDEALRQVDHFICHTT